jgi:hypothetical protein
MLTAITDRQAVNQAFRKMRASLIHGTRGEIRWIGFPSGQLQGSVRWLEDEGYWCSVADPELHAQDNRYWSAFGTVPRSEAKDPLTITAEINPPKEGVNRRCAGILAEDSSGTQYLLHSGKIGGGKPGIGRSAFLSYLESPNQHELAWPDGQVTRAILIGRIDRPALRGQVGEFIRTVAAFKSGSPAPLPTPDAGAESTFAEEFAGTKRAYSVSAVIEATCNHGYVIRSLRKAVEAADVGTVGKDIARDLFVHRKGVVIVLFEAKTDATPQSIYTGIGQLMLHTATQSPAPHRVLILPDAPDEKTRQRLSALGIEVVTYSLRGHEAVFQNLDRVLRKI